MKIRGDKQMRWSEKKIQMCRRRLECQSNSEQKCTTHLLSTKCPITTVRPIQDNEGCYSNVKVLTHNEMQTDSKGSYVILASAVTIWVIATVGQHEQYILWRDWEQRTPCASGSYCTGASPLQPVPASSQTLLHSHTREEIEKGTINPFQYSPLSICTSLNTENTYSSFTMLINYKQTCSMIIKLYVFQQEIALLIMNDFLLCGK